MDKNKDGLWLGLLALLAFFSGTLFELYWGWEIELTNCLMIFKRVAFVAIDLNKRITHELQTKSWHR